MADVTCGILLKSVIADEKHDENEPFQKKIDKGELVVEIPKKDRIPRGVGKDRGKDPAHNYHVHNEPTVTLYDDGVGVCPLEKTEFECLAAVPDRTVRFAQYKTGKMEWVSTLQLRDLVFFQMFVDPNAKARPIIKGKIRYFGETNDGNGFKFGIEIMDHNFKGQGTTDGHPYFNCGHKNAMFVAMDKITKKVNGEGDGNIGKEGSSGDHEPIKSQPLKVEGPPAANLRSSHTKRSTGAGNGEGGTKTFYEKAMDFKDKLTSFASPNPPSATPTRTPSKVPSKFSLGDRVILQLAKGGIVTGVVKWVGPVKTSRETGGIVIPVVGIETSRPVNSEKEFPGLHYGVTGSHGQELFTVARNHGRIFLAEQVVLAEDEYKNMKREEESEEVREAKKWGLSVEEYRQQRELLSERNTERDQVNDKRKLNPTSHENEENTTAGGSVRKIKGNELEETIRLGPDGNPLMHEDMVKKQQEALKPFEKQKSTENEYELVNHPQDSSQLPQSSSLSGQYPPSGNPKVDIGTQGKHHEQQHRKEISNKEIEMTPTESWQLVPPNDRTDPHGRYGTQFSDDMNETLHPPRSHAGYDSHQSPSLQSHYNNPSRYDLPRQPPGGSSTSSDNSPMRGHRNISSGNIPSLGTTGQLNYDPSTSGHTPLIVSSHGSSISGHAPSISYSHGSSASGHTPPIGTGHSSLTSGHTGTGRYHLYGESSTNAGDPLSSGHTPPMGSGGQPRHPTIPSDPSDFTVGTMVNVQMQHGGPRHGVIEWIGTLPNMDGWYAGVELDEYLDGCSDGSFDGRRYFNCTRGRGLFCLVSALKLDRRYMESHQVPAARKQDLKNPLSDIPQYDESDIPGGPELFSKYIGDYHGIQGHHNSCYLDATVFGLFALSDSFDELLLEEPDTEIGQTIRNILWKGVINPLRKCGVARFESIMELRNQLEALGRMKGANRDEKDPEEFLNLLFKEILHVVPFISIKRPFGVEKEFFVQLFFEIDDKQTGPPNTEKLINKMFHEQNISFTTVPSKLLLQMPRFGKEFKMFSKIIPSQEINVKSLLEGGHNPCELCKESNATIQCSSCSDEVFQSCKYLCEKCSNLVHKPRPDHKPEPATFSSGPNDVSRFSKMQLLSVICIETSHYVCFTRTGDKWLFHDSMADRLYDTFNIPKVTEVSQELNHWVYNPDNHQKLLQSPSRDIPECVRRFTQDIYMCVYTNSDLDKYGDPSYSLSSTVE